MTAKAITWLEIRAYSRETFAPLSAWDKRLIRRIDDAILPILNPAPESSTVSARDGKGVLAMIRGAGARHKRPE